MFYSPYDLDASAAKKRSTYWIGYKVHCTETCDEDLPRLITHVATDIGPIPDRETLPAIHSALDQKELLPEQHLVDAGYVDAELLVASQTDVFLILARNGPVFSPLGLLNRPEQKHRCHGTFHPPARLRRSYRPTVATLDAIPIAV